MAVFGISQSPNETNSILCTVVITGIFGENPLYEFFVFVPKIHRQGALGKRPDILFDQDLNEEQAMLRNSKRTQEQ